MNTEILMAASGVITLAAAYVGLHSFVKAKAMAKELNALRQIRDASGRFVSKKKLVAKQMAREMGRSDLEARL